MDINKDTKIVDIVNEQPRAAVVFKRHGFFTLMARLQGGAMGDVTVEKACSQQGADMDKLITDLKAEVDACAHSSAPSDTGEVKITKKMKTKEVTDAYPASKSVFIKHFGKGCFDCPAFGTEDLAFASMMHNTDPNQFVRECIEAVIKDREAKADTSPA
ncbi:MAG: hypothetical protein ACUZ8A_07970 [Candidatus Bathyanammoxibius sp.]|jgi:hypothetical protein